MPHLHNAPPYWALLYLPLAAFATGAANIANSMADNIENRVSAKPLAGDWSIEQRQVLALEQNVAMVLTHQGFAAYSALFHPNYSNWADGKTLRNRHQFLDAVQSWFAAGQHAVATEIKVHSIDIFADYALSRYTLREDFNDGSSFVGDFVSLSKRQHGQWLLYRSSFHTQFRGPAAAAPSLQQAASSPAMPSSHLGPTGPGNHFWI